MTDFGERIKKIRLQRGMTQGELAEVIGISEATLSRYEHNLRTSRWIYLVKMADLLGTSVDYLLGRTDLTVPVDILFKFHDSEVEKDSIFAAYDKMDDHQRALLMERAASLYKSRAEKAEVFIEE
jgi:transcriptional regulator with XRE-family HTH domain